MDKFYYRKAERAPKGTGRKAEINSIRVPDYIKEQLDCWKEAYEAKLKRKITYEQMFMWWMDNIGFTSECWDNDIREIAEKEKRINIFNSVKNLVDYLNKKGRFWEFCNQASERLPQEEIIQKALLFLELEDVPQLFNLFGYENCKNVFENNIKNKGKYYNKISFILESFYF